MSHQKLREDLENLRIQIGALDAYPEAKSRMSELLTDFEKHLGSMEGASQSRNSTDADTSSLKHRLDDSMDRFKAEHPILTGILNNIMDTLSGMGI